MSNRIMPSRTRTWPKEAPINNLRDLIPNLALSTLTKSSCWKMIKKN